MQRKKLKKRKGISDENRFLILMKKKKKKVSNAINITLQDLNILTEYIFLF